MKSTSLSDAFYNHPLIKSLSRPGKHPSYVPSKTFALTLLDIFAKGQAITGTAEQRLAQIKASIGNLPDSDVKKSLQALLMNGSDSVEKVEEKLEGWFNDSMDRVSGMVQEQGPGLDRGDREPGHDPGERGHHPDCAETDD